MNRDKAIVVTGAAGFIGSCVIRHLNDQGHTHIIAVDQLDTTDKWKNLVGKKFSHMLDRDDLLSWLKGRENEIGGFIHLGACSDTMEKDAGYLLRNNYTYTVNLAEYALSNNCRFIYASSAATYGDGSQGFSDDHALLDTLKPLNMYGYSKHLFDLWLLRQGLLDRVVGLKYFNIFGPNEWHKGRMCSPIQKLLPSIQRGEPLRLFQSSDPKSFGDGEQKRDFLYAKDAARMTCAFLDNDAGGIFNIGSGVASSWNQLGSAMFRAIDRAPAIEYVPMPEELVGKYQNYTCAEMTKAKGALGAICDTPPLEETVRDYIQGHLIPEKMW